jgi:hypothetical protein
MSLDEKADVMAGSCVLSSTSSCWLGVNHLHPEILKFVRCTMQQLYERKT